jgi:anthranilate synthase component 1
MIVTSQKIVLKTVIKKYLADVFTPVGTYLKVRDRFSETVLLESTDFRSLENCRSFIGVEPIAKFLIQNGQVELQFPDGSKTVTKLHSKQNVSQLFSTFKQQFDVKTPNGILNGFFGHTAYDAVQYFDTLDFDTTKRKTNLPDMHYSLYRYIIGFDHFKDEMTILENIPTGQNSRLESLESIIKGQPSGTFSFKLVGEEKANMTDEDYKKLVSLGKHHCQMGDVFQIVLSRRYTQAFTGDDLNLYRALRTINPSPYLFYFDYGSYKIFGSSPEAQLVVEKNGMASVNPIAGTYRRTGDDEADAQKARELRTDPKEVAEHIMLVDLARNDLSKHCKSVKVKELKEVQYFSHVIHLVSKVEGQILPNANSAHVFADTFPAGTLSGAPKYKAMQLIDAYEPENRHFYGGAIGYVGFNGEMNQAIVIRSFLSHNNLLHYQAGAGIVAASKEEDELQEVNNKLGALKRALKAAEQI